MRIWLITVGEPLPMDGEHVRLLRTGLLAGVLEAAGHQVVWWSSSFHHTAKCQRVSQDTTFVRSPRLVVKLLYAPGYPRNLSIRRIRNHRRIARRFAAAAAQEDPPDVILCSFPTVELSKAATVFGAARGIPVILDIRDLWPDALIQVVPRLGRPFAKAMLGGMRREARDALRRASGLIAVSPQYLQWGLQYAGRSRSPQDGVFPLGYHRPTIPEDLLQGAAKRLRALGVDPAKTICWFVGVFGRTYDLATVIDAVRELDDRIRHRVQFVLCGDGDYRKAWLARAAGLDCVIFPGWVDAAELAYLARISSIGLAAYAAGAPQGLPNKIFEYLAAGVPILSSLQGETETLLRENECGLTYEAENPRSFCEALGSLVRNSDWGTTMGQRGGRLFEERFAAERIYSDLMAHIETVRSALNRGS